MKEVKVGTQITCCRCSHVWRARGNGKATRSTVRICPKCKSPYFDKARLEVNEPVPAKGRR